jgi:hypothetical protein
MLMRANFFRGPLATCVAQKIIDFQGPPLPMALEMDLPASKSFCVGIGMGGGGGRSGTKCMYFKFKLFHKSHACVLL